MTFSPVVPLAGVPGLRFLERTADAQVASFNNQPQIVRDTEYFKENITSVTSAEELVKDRRLLRVALGAFGLDEDLGKSYFLQKMLEEGTDDPASLANRFVDPRYRTFSSAFGFGNIGGSRIGLPGFADNIVESYKTRQYEIAIGESDPNMRLALGFKREIAEFANSDGADSYAWFSVLGNQPLRTVFEEAYSLPTAFGTLDIDKQRDIMREKTTQLFGTSSLEVFKEPDALNTLVDRFLTMKQVRGDIGPGSTGSAALSILSSSPSNAPSAIFNILVSNSA